MIKVVLFCCIPVLILAAAPLDASNGFGAGIMLGDPTGISLKSWISKTKAWDGGIAWGLGRDDALYLHGDLLYHKFNFIPVQEGKLPLYYGAGIRLLFAHESHLGVRGVVGLDYMFAGIPLDLFLELAPVLDLVPATELNMNGALGIRYFF
jgi:hypothetical protein